MASFRDHLFPLDHPRLAGLAELDATAYGDAMKEHPIAGPLIAAWLDSFEQTSFRGITSDGSVVPDLFPLGADEGAPTEESVAAAQALLDHLGEADRDRLVHPLGSKVWRAWMNPEFYLNRFGLRLEELDDETRGLALRLVAAGLSEEGYEQAVAAMRTNAFLGELTGLPNLLNEGSYNLNVFGTPSTTEPWGWNLYGHHLCLNAFFLGGQQVLTPVFFGAEPNRIDEGPLAGTHLLHGHARAGRDLVRSLPAGQAEVATLFERKRDPAMPAGRVHPADELHLGGAFQDNRLIPYEGLRLAQCSPEVQQKVLDLVEVFLGYQADGPRAARLAQVREHLDDTWFCWIGGTGDEDVFYFRVQSPVILIEFDHHAGIWLANQEPEPFHIHVLVRTPNGGDYGAALVTAATGREQLLDGPA